nr:uncharacterized protein LOC105719386 [Aotus nancymaae]
MRLNFGAWPAALGLDWESQKSARPRWDSRVVLKGVVFCIRGVAEASEIQGSSPAELSGSNRPWEVGDRWPPPDPQAMWPPLLLLLLLLPAAPVPTKAAPLLDANTQEGFQNLLQGVQAGGDRELRAVSYLAPGSACSNGAVVAVRPPSQGGRPAAP